MILLAVFLASVTILGAGVLIGWAARGEPTGEYERGYEDALTATAWLNYEDVP